MGFPLVEWMTCRMRGKGVPGATARSSAIFESAVVSVDFFICVRKLDFAVAFQNGKTGNCTFRRNVPRRTAEMGNSTLNQSLDP